MEIIFIHRFLRDSEFISWVDIIHETVLLLNSEIYNVHDDASKFQSYIDAETCYGSER